MKKENKYKASKILEEVSRLKKEYPEAVYSPGPSIVTCSYSKGHVKNGPKTKGCPIGQAIRNVYPDLFEKVKNGYDTEAVDEVLCSTEIVCSEKQKERLLKIQANNDDLQKWGKC